MRLDMVTLITEGDATTDADGFVTNPNITQTEVSAELLANSLSDEISGAQGGWNISLKVAVDRDDYDTAFITNTAGRKVRPRKLSYNGVTYIIKKPVENFKTHQMELLCTEVE